MTVTAGFPTTARSPPGSMYIDIKQLGWGGRPLAGGWTNLGGQRLGKSTS